MSADYSFKEQADMLYCYGFADGDSEEAAKIYSEKFPKRNHPDPEVFKKIDLQLRERGSLRQDKICLTPTMADADVKRRGRPKKKEVSELPTKRAALSNGDDGPPAAKRGRGRPPKSGGNAKKVAPPSGRGRGRPPTKQQSPSKKKKKDSEDEEEIDEEEEKKDSSNEAEDSS